MKFLKEFTIACPEGYIPIQRPKTWNISSTNAYAPKPPVFSITFRSSNLVDFDLIDAMTERLMNLDEVSSVCMSQLAKSPINDFLIGVPDRVITAALALVSQNSRLSKLTDINFDISACDIFLFQRNPKSLLVA
jgi:hypothetical protein